MDLRYNLLATLSIIFFTTCNAANSKHFREYIGAEFNSVKFSDVPINSEVEFHFILAFAIDYTIGKNPAPTNGKFNIFWDSDNLSPSDVASIKHRHSSVKVAVSLGGDSVQNKKAFFVPKSIDSWVQNAVSSLTNMIKQYGLDGIDIDYEHFSSDPNIFAECIGRLILNVKKSGTIKFASIAPYDDGQIQNHYLALWRKYGHVIDYVNFQFHAYDKIGVSEFVRHFNEQVVKYKGGQILASFISDGSLGLGPGDGFFEACEKLKGEEQLGGVEC